MINRAAVMLRYKAPAVAWINEADPGGGRELTLADVNRERTVYLIREEDADTASQLAAWIKTNYESFFESELEAWYTATHLWPKDRSFKRFQEWFDVECHTVLIDTVGGPLSDDES
ncbi:MAG: hypothetical protein KDA60_22220 [Planctomycetales bacterium]|nr:hypothetical protein [Planctomycetales bacterium]